MTRRVHVKCYNKLEGDNMNIKKELSKVCDDIEVISYLNDIEIDVQEIKCIMINEVVPNDPKDDFYGSNIQPYYLQTTIPLFQESDESITDVYDILQKGIYITNAVKLPKEDYSIETSFILKNAEILEKELSLFPNVQVIMLMGDVAKKAFNAICKKQTKKNVVPSISTYKLRNSKLYYNGIRIFPSYIMTGQNILIEKSKFKMASEDIANMLDIIS